jgi:hypothetical protein
MYRIKVSIIFLFIILSAIPSFASSTRDMGLGLFENPWFIDGLQTYIYENPSMLREFKDSAYAERIGVIDGQNTGGIIYNPVKTLAFAVLLGYPVDDSLWNSDNIDSLFHIDTYEAKSRSLYTHSVSGQDLGPYQAELMNGIILDLTDPEDATALVGTDISSPVIREHLKQRNLSIMLVYDFGKYSLGLGFGYATSWINKRDGDSDASLTEEYNLINAEYSSNLGGTYRINEAVSIDASGNFYLYTLDNNYTKTEPGINMNMSYATDNAGAFDYGMTIRLNYRMTLKHLMHFYGGFSILNRTTSGNMLITDENNNSYNVNTIDKFDRTGQKYNLGVSDEFILAGNIKTFLGFNVRFEQFKVEYSGIDMITPANNLNIYTAEYQSINLPIIIGMESNLSKNWQARFSISQDIYRPFINRGTNITGQGGNIQPTSINDVASSSTEFTLGLSYAIGNFSIDWLANIELFTVGPNIVSGKSWTTTQQNPLAMAFAITYRFPNAEEKQDMDY